MGFELRATRSAVRPSTVAPRGHPEPSHQTCTHDWCFEIVFPHNLRSSRLAEPTLYPVGDLSQLARSSRKYGQVGVQRRRVNSLNRPLFELSSCLPSLVHSLVSPGSVGEISYRVVGTRHSWVTWAWLGFLLDASDRLPRSGLQSSLTSLGSMSSPS